MSPSDVAWLILSVAALGAVAEWRLHHNRSAIVSDLKLAMLEVAKAAVIDAVSEAMKLERVNGAAIDALSEHVASIDERLVEVELIMKAPHQAVPGESGTSGGA